MSKDKEEREDETLQANDRLRKEQVEVVRGNGRERVKQARINKPRGRPHVACVTLAFTDRARCPLPS